MSFHYCSTASPKASALLPIATDVTVGGSSTCICLSSVTLMHPAKAIGRNEMPYGKDTVGVPSNIVLDGPQSRQRKERFGGRNPSQNLCCKLWPTRSLHIADLLL